MKQTIVYILSTPFAGSHFLSLMLGSHTRATHVGELNLLLKEKSERALEECKLNRGNLLAGIGPDNIENVYDLVFDRIGKGTDVLVDASKRVSWAQRFVENRSYGRKYIHLIRDPRALVRRYGNRSYFPRRFGHRWKVFKKFAVQRPGLLFASHPVLRRYYWLMQNQAITQFISRNALDHNLVTYRDLATDPATEVARLMKWIGLPFEPPQLEYWNFKHLGTEKKAYEWVKEKKEMFIDLRWKTELPAVVQHDILSDVMVQRYVRGLGLNFVDTGLTRLEVSEANTN